jgi:hypothetical protein
MEREGRREGWEGNRIEGKGREWKGRGGRKRGGEGMDAPGAGPPQNFWARTATGTSVYKSAGLKVALYCNCRSGYWPGLHASCSLFTADLEYMYCRAIHAGYIKRQAVCIAQREITHFFTPANPDASLICIRNDFLTTTVLTVPFYQ